MGVRRVWENLGTWGGGSCPFRGRRVLCGGWALREGGGPGCALLPFTLFTIIYIYIFRI